MIHFAPGLLSCYSAPLCVCLTFSGTLYDLHLIKTWAFLCTVTAINCPKLKVTNGAFSWRLNEPCSRAILQAFRLRTPHVLYNHRGNQAAAITALSVRSATMSTASTTTCKSVTACAPAASPGSSRRGRSPFNKGEFQTQACVVNSPLLDRSWKILTWKKPVKLNTPLFK